MGTIADKLAFLGQTKAEIRDAIASKGVMVPPATTFREYAGKIREITSDGGANPEDWKRPEDWLVIKDRVAEGDQKFVGLYAIFEEGNFVSFAATGDYTVDWGDGVIENVASGVPANHTYSYHSFPGTETAMGYRQAIVTITPQNNGDLTGLFLQVRHNQPSLSFSYSTGWLDISMSGQNIRNLTIGGTTAYHRYLESFCFLGQNAITDFNRFFYGCTRLQSVPVFDTANGLDFSYMFHHCTVLKNVPLLNTANGINFSYMFQNCVSLQSVPLFDTSRGIDFSFMFGWCYKLESIPFLDTSNGVVFYNMFIACTYLKTIPLFNTAKGVDFRYMFVTCSSLETVPELKTSGGTLFTGMFSNCTALRSIPLLDTTKGTDFNDMFYACNRLESIPLLNTSNGINFSSMFTNCGGLTKGSLFNTGESISYFDCKLSPAALVDVFKNLASGVVSKTIVIENNWGAPLLTKEERTIATDKGWIILG